VTDPGVPDEWPDGPPVPVGDVLRHGAMTVHGRIPGSSNATLLVTCTHQGCELLAVYKPAQGERPLWDFPSGLHRREVGAYVLSEALGWGLVPDTVERLEGPYGEGSVQRYVPEDGQSHYFTLRDDPAWTDTLVALAAFDVVANNADRKSGHVLLAEERLWAIDNGLCFHVQPKLRTVVWDFGGTELPAPLRDDLRRLLDDGVPDELVALLAPDEVAALEDRTAALLAAGALPELRDDDGWPPYPWPLV
jgi:uncharacterized repeat protein (TIGR03843 family)